MDSEFKNLREKGEIAAERGDLDGALAELEKAIIMAIGQKDYKGAINILGHHLHIYKKHFQETGNEAFMELFYMDTQTGLRLAEKYNVEGQPKSVMQLRAGNYFDFTGDAKQAAGQYAMACEELNKASQEAPETNAEYKGHYALALVKSGDTKQGFKLFGESLNLIESNNTIRPFHHEIIQSGILLRQAEAYWFLGEKR